MEQKETISVTEINARMQALRNQRENVADECVHLQGKLAAANETIAKQNAELKELRGKLA